MHEGAKTLVAGVVSSFRRRRRPRAIHVLIAAAIVPGTGAGLAAESTSTTAQATVVFAPAADAFVEQAYPTRSNGGVNRLISDRSPMRESFLRFTVSGLTGTVTGARLRLWVYDQTSDGPKLHLVGTSWSESGLTWGTRPSPTSGVIGDTGSLPKGTWAEYNVSSVVKGNGAFGFALLPASSNGVYLYSKEGTRKPELVVTTSAGVGADTTPPSAPGGLSVGPSAQTSIGMTWNASTDDVGVARYDLYAGGTKVGATTQTSHTFTTLSCATAYTLGVAAVDAAGNVSSRPTVNASTGACAAARSSLTPPLRGAFYYPWYPETWTVNGAHVLYTPQLGYYGSSSAIVVDAHVRELDRAKIDVAIASWWGQSTHSEATRIPLLLNRTTALSLPLRWSVYYEPEGSGNPTVTQLRAQLGYLMATYAGRPEYARVGGKPVIFVYNVGDGCEVADRWRQATGGQWYVSLKVFSGYRTCASQPDTWHQYAGSSASDRQSGYSYTISPGFWRADEPSPRLARDPVRFKQNVRDMVASNEPWQLVVSFNEWGEGTAVEQATQWGSTYLDALATDGGTPPPPPTLPPPPPPPSTTATFAAVGDLGGNSRSEATLGAIGSSGASFALLLGDASYEEVAPESAGCTWTRGRLPIGFELVAGNHEEDSRVDGFIRSFAACMPSRMGAIGDYGTEYYFDTGPLRVIMIAANLTVDAVRYDYVSGNPHYTWLRDRIRDAKAGGRQVVVAMHKNCLTAGTKPCEIGDALQDLLIAERVDLVLHGHEHTYQRLAQLSCANPGVFEAACVADSGADGVYSADGTVFVIAGSGGRSLNTINQADPEYPYVTRWLGAQSPNAGQGFLKLVVSPTEIAVTFVGATTTFTDSFVIR